MSSFKNKINNKKKRKKENMMVNELIELKKKMKEQYQAGEYVEAMDTMAELAEHRKMDPEIMYMGASCYFMTGDYERASKWVNNTLSYDPQNISARLLLARLCFVEERPEDGFSILSFVVEKYDGGMREEDSKLLLEMLEYCNDNMATMMNNYPALVEYFHKNYTAPVIQPAPTLESSSIQDMLEAAVPIEESKTKAKAAVDRLKALLNKSKGHKDENAAESEPAKKTQLVRVTEQVNNELPAQIIEKVMSSNVSLMDKVQSLNNFASGLYLEGDYIGAMSVLKQALQIDAHNSLLLKNMAYICLAMEEKDKALECASAMPMVDFALLRAIKGHCHE